MSSIRIVVSRRLWHGGREFAPGEVIECSELAAVQLLESGRCALHNPADAARLRDVARAELKRVMHRLGPLPAPPGSPWGPWPR